MTAPTLGRRDLAALVLAAAAWGLGTVISKRALDEMPALTLLPIQLGASLVVLGALMRRQGLALRGSPPILARLGVLNPGLAYALGLLGLGSITASGILLLGEGLDVRQWTGAAIVLVAVLVITFRPTASPLAAPVEADR